MSTHITTNIEVPRETVRTLDTFRQQVAAYYANILHGLHLRKEPMVYTFPYTLTGHTFEPSQLQPHLHTLLAAKLALKDGTDIQFTYTRVLREANMIHADSEVELRLRIEVTIITC